MGAGDVEATLWGIGIKGDASTAQLKSEVSLLANVYPFKVPAAGFRVGTLDSLMSLSDDLSKMDTLAEATVAKFFKQLQDLVPDQEPTIMGVPVAAFTTMQWEWEEAKFQLKTPLRELSESISLRISSLDEELKVKTGELQVLRASLQAIERKTQGNLMVRGLADLVDESMVIESEYMTTMWCVVQKALMKEFETGYERMATYVVPKSAILVSEDSEYALYRVIIFKKSLDEFKASAARSG
jgi:V-type H+-transporting ATPase subunit C